MRRTVPCFHVKTAAPIIRSAAISSASAGGNTNGVSSSNEPRRPPICASTGTCAVPSPGSCGRIPPGILCGEAEHRCVLIVDIKIQRFILWPESTERVETKRKTRYPACLSFCIWLPKRYRSTAQASTVWRGGMAE